MMKDDYIPLAEIVEELENGSRPEGGVNDSGDVFSVGGEHLNDFGDFDFSSVKLISHDFYNQMKRGKVKPDDIIIVKDGATTGKTSFVSEQFPHFPCAINEHVFRLAVNQKVADPKYIFYYLYSPKGNKEILDDFRGATVGGISQDFINKVFIPLPPLDEQKRIASLLARADRLRGLRRAARALGQSLLQGVFLEMFGDVVRNDKNWKIMSLGQTCDEIYRYPTFYGFDYVEEGIPVVRIGDILSNGEVNPNLENYVCIKPEINKRFPRTILELGDILMAVRGDGSTGKRIGMVKSKNLVGANISPNLLRFKANEKYVSSSYLFHFMTSSGGQELIDRYITRTAKKTITSTDIQTIRIPVPPLSLQEEFARVVARVEGLRGRMSESERQVEGLFGSLLSQSFS